MKSLYILKAILVVVLLSLSFAQEAQTPPPNDQQPPPTPSSLNSDPSQPVPDNAATSSEPIVVDANQQQAEPAKPSEEVQPESATPDAQQQIHQNTQTKESSVKMKERIKKMLSEMTDEELKEFQKQLGGDSQKFYEQLWKEQQNREMAEDKWQEEELHQMEEAQEIQSQDIQMRKQMKEFEKQWKTIADVDVHFQEYMFQLDQSASQDFRFTIPVSQNITFYGYTYENNDGVYSISKSSQGKQPISLYVYENNQRIVFQKQFHFQYFANFKGNENCSYLIRFVNPSSHKLVTFNLKTIFEAGHSAEKLHAADVADHSSRIERSRNQVTNRYQDISSRDMMAVQNRGELMDKLDRYFTYSIVQIVIIAVLCVLQVKFVRKLLASTSVV